jgi:hypothetical protein
VLQAAEYIGRLNDEFEDSGGARRTQGRRVRRTSCRAGRRRRRQPIGLQGGRVLSCAGLRQQPAVLRRTRLRAKRLRSTHRRVLRHVERVPQRKLRRGSLRVLACRGPGELALRRARLLPLGGRLLRRRFLHSQRWGSRDLLQPDRSPLLERGAMLQRKLHRRTVRLPAHPGRRTWILRLEQRLLQWLLQRRRLRAPLARHGVHDRQ